MNRTRIGLCIREPRSTRPSYPERHDECRRRESNPQQTAPKAATSASWVTPASQRCGTRGSNPASSVCKTGAFTSSLVPRGLGGGIRTPGLRHPEPALYQVEPHPDAFLRKFVKRSTAIALSAVWVEGFEPPVPGSRRRCSTRLSHTQMNCKGYEESRRRESNPRGQPYESCRSATSRRGAPAGSRTRGRRASEARVWCRQNRGRIRGVLPGWSDSAPGSELGLPARS